MSNICRSTRSIAALAIFMVIGLSQAVMGQTKEMKGSVQYIACGIDTCSFVAQSPSDEELKFIYFMHSTMYHNKSLKDAEIFSLMVKGSFTPQNKNIKSIACPDKDGFALWSNFDDVLVYFYKQHAEFVHDRKMSDSDVKKMITTLQ